MVKGLWLSDLYEKAEERLAMIPKAKEGDSSLQWKDELYEEIYREIRWIVSHCPSNEEAEAAGMGALLLPYAHWADRRKVYSGEVSIRVAEGVWQGKKNSCLPYVGRFGIDWRFLPD